MRGSEWHFLLFYYSLPFSEEASTDRQTDTRSVPCFRVATSLWQPHQEVFIQRPLTALAIYICNVSAASLTQHALQLHRLSEYKCHSGHEEGRRRHVGKLLICSLGWTSWNNNAVRTIFIYSVCICIMFHRLEDKTSYCN